jgi:ParB family chromosome partitioning protein
MADNGGELRSIPVELLRRGKYQPRTHMDPSALEELAASIRVHGVVQPIVVRPLGKGEYEIIAGERRWRAAQIAGLETVPAVVRPVPDEAAIAIALIENIQRENLNPVEEAYAFRRLIDEFKMTHEVAAHATGRKRDGVTHLLRLLTLDPEVLRLLEDGEKNGFTCTHARALVTLDRGDQLRLARRVVEEGVSSKALEKVVAGMSHPGRRRQPSRHDPDVERLERWLSARFGMSVKFRFNKKDGSGQAVFSYSSLDNLDSLLTIAGYRPE